MKLNESPQFRCRGDHERDEGRYLFTSTHTQVLIIFAVAQSVVMPVSSEEVLTAAVREVEISSVVKDNAQKRRVDVKPSVVLDEPQFSELVHKKIHAGARCANHFGQHFLRYFG